MTIFQRVHRRPRPRPHYDATIQALVDTGNLDGLREHTRPSDPLCTDATLALYDILRAKPVLTEDEADGLVLLEDAIWGGVH